MRLRARLAAATIAVTVPMVLGLMIVDGQERHRVAGWTLGDHAARRASDPAEQGRCEQSPATWGTRPPRRGPHETPGPGPWPPPPGDPGADGPPFGEGPPPDPMKKRGGRRRPPPPMLPGGAPPIFYAYDAQGRSANPSAPRLDPSLIERVERERRTPLSAAWYEENVYVLVATAWGSGPCAYMVIHGTTTPGFLGSILPAGQIWLLPLVAVLMAILVAVGPVITRIRRLAEDVRRSAETGFAGGVPASGDDEIAELARAFDAAGREVRAQLAAKDQRERALRDFLANTTHDVMSPLTVLQAQLVILRERQAAGVVDGPETLASAMNAAHYIGALLHNLAIAAQLDAGEPALLKGPVDLGALVSRVISRHRPLALQRRIQLEHALPLQPLEAEADVTLLEQAVNNIVYNAIRYNRPDGHVAVVLEPVEGRRFRIRVVDDGPVIDPEEVGRLVVRGQPGDQARTRAPDGQGLGLDITDRVARLHGFDLRFGPSEYGGLEVNLEGAATSA